MTDNKGLEPGTVLHGTYRIEKILGQGGFGITYLAFDMKLDRYVAIKEFFPKEYCGRDGSTSQVTVGTENSKQLVENLKKRFIKEAKNIAKFDHPGIIRIHSAFEENQTAYYVMDYIKGKSMQDLVKRKGPLSEDDALRYIRSVGEALEYVHGHSTNHFDIKPANILIRESDDRAILIDFGLSKRYDKESEKDTSTIVGMSAGYAPIEQYSAGGVKGFSPQTDIYALGATLYYLLSGIAPTEAPKLVDQELIFPAEIPEKLIGPISKAMSSGRKDRQPTVEQFLSDLDSGSGSILDKVTHKMPSWLLTAVIVAIGIGIGVAGVCLSKCTHSGGEEVSGIVIDTPLDSDSATTEQDSSFVSTTPGQEITDNPDPTGGQEGTEEPAPEPVADEIIDVKDFVWESPLGKALYSGQVLKKGETGEQIPTGKGVAQIVAGKYKDCVYDGEFDNGKMHGKAKYTLANGDVFDGTYVNNKYGKGRYTVAETGAYFEGTYNENMKPDKGTWYDKDGYKIE